MEKAGQPIQHAYFPSTGILSVVARSGNDKIEVGLLGREGMTGLSVLLQTRQASNDCFVQVAGEGLRMPVDPLGEAFDRSRTLRNRLLAYLRVMLDQIANTALANGRFTVEQRLARWLLMCQDRSDGNEFALTHEFLALMLGVRRSSVSVALDLFQQQGVISHRRGSIGVVYRAGLLALAGGAYHPARDQADSGL